MLEVRTMTRARTLLQWFEEYQNDRIDMNPSYQRRGGLWPVDHRKLLINSILNNYDIPKIYLSDFTYANTPLNESNKPYAVIDGKQRLEIFFGFFRDGLTLDDTPIYFDNQELILDGLCFSDLRQRYPKLAVRFEQFVPTVMSVISDHMEDVQELFIRLNLNVFISGAERRNAMAGPLPPLIRKLSVHDFFRVCVKFPIHRGQDLNNAAKMLLMENDGGFVTAKKEELDRFVKRNRNEPASKFEEIYHRVETTLTKMAEIFQERDSLLSVQANVPIYYWLVRKHADRHAYLIRPFLEHFEEERAKVRAQSRARSKGEQVEISDQELNDYNRIIRSPDDRSNLDSMFGTLERKFFDYMKDMP